MVPQPIRTFVVAVAGALVLPALALIPIATARGEEPAEPTPAQPAAPAPTAAPIPTAVVSAKVPAAVVGKWRYGSISPTTIHDAQTGKHLGNARSLGSFVEFAADGSYKQYTLTSMNTNGWALSTWAEEYGEAAFDPAKGTVALKATNGKYRVTDNRVKKNNYDRPMTDEEVKKAAVTLTYKLARGE